MGIMRQAMDGKSIASVNNGGHDPVY